MGNGDEADRGRLPPEHLRKPTDEDLRRRFFYHQLRDGDAVTRHEKVSHLCFNLALDLRELCYPGRQLSLALTALEEVRMRANASIACDDPRP